MSEDEAGSDVSRLFEYLRAGGWGVTYVALDRELAAGPGMRRLVAHVYVDELELLAGGGD